MLQRRFLRFVVGALLSLPLLLAGGGRASDEITFAIQADSADQQQQPQKSFITYDNVQQQQQLPPTTYKVISSELLRIGANQKDYPQRFASAAQQQKQQQQQGAPQYTITDTQRYEIPTQQYYPLQQQQQQQSGISAQQNLPQQQQQQYVQTQLRPQAFDQQAQFQQLYRQQPTQLQQQQQQPQQQHQQQPQQQHQQQLVFQKQPTPGSELAPLNSMKFSPLLASYITNPVEPTNGTIACTICCNLLEDPCTECCSTPLVSQNALKSAAG